MFEDLSGFKLLLRNLLGDLFFTETISKDGPLFIREKNNKTQNRSGMIVFMIYRERRGARAAASAGFTTDCSVSSFAECGWPCVFAFVSMYVCVCTYSSLLLNGWRSLSSHQDFNNTFHSYFSILDCNSRSMLVRRKGLAF